MPFGWVSLLTVVASGALAGLSAWGVAWLNRKGAKEVAAATTTVQMRSLDQALIDRLQTQIDKQDQRISLLDTHRQEDRHLIDELQRSLDREERGRAAAIRYIRKLLDWISEHMPGATPPDIPVALREDLA